MRYSAAVSPLYVVATRNHQTQSSLLRTHKRKLRNLWKENSQLMEKKLQFVERKSAIYDKKIGNLWQEIRNLS